MLVTVFFMLMTLQFRKSVTNISKLSPTETVSNINLAHSRSNNLDPKRMKESKSWISTQNWY